MSAELRRILSAALCAASGAAIVLISPATASAEPLPPVPLPPVEPAPVQGAPVQGPPPPAPAPLTLNAVNVPAPTSDVADQAVTVPLPTPPPDGVPHLASPDALPPGSTMDPTTQGNDSPNVSYLKDLWHAVQNQEISGTEALLLGIAQRGMNTPIPEQAPGPNVPISPGDPALAPPPPAASPVPPPAAPLPPTP